MQALKHGARCSGGLGQLGFLARPLASLLDFLPSLLQKKEFATHGVADAKGSKEGGVVRFYKAVDVKEADSGKVTGPCPHG
jgi:hypothetical protein